MGVVAQCELQFEVHENFGCEVKGVGWGLGGVAEPSPSDHNLWDVIVNGDIEEEPAPTIGETSAPSALKTAKQLAARRNQERVKSILLLAIPNKYLLKFHNVDDAKSL
ncbi:hypothetical protein Tco_0337669 [Tanacetum coccineum]